MIGHYFLEKHGLSIVTAPENIAFLQPQEHSTGHNCIYAWIPTGASKMQKYEFYCAFTGETLPDQINNVAQFVGTIMRKDGLVVHVFQLGKF